MRVLRNKGFFKSGPNGNGAVDGMIRSENFTITDRNIGNYRFGPIYRNIGASAFKSNPAAFGPGMYNVITNNCQDYCTYYRGSK